jgi:type IV secretory pathway VirB2 component (pilin)
MATDDVTGRGDRIDRRSGFPLWPGRRGRRLRTAVIGVVLAGYAWAAGAAEPLTTTALVFVLIPGVVLAAIAYAWPPERIPPPDRLDITGMFWWVIAVAALFEWEASAYKDNSLPWHPSLTDLINPLIGPHILRSAAILLWIMVGWALVRR